jgi:hypothetical protein
MLRARRRPVNVSEHFSHRQRPAPVRSWAFVQVSEVFVPELWFRELRKPLAMGGVRISTSPLRVCS